MILFKLIFTVISLIGIIRPDIMWVLSEGWKYKDVEPSETYLILSRVLSVIALILVWVIS